jgi:hypothetical protein
LLIATVAAAAAPRPPWLSHHLTIPLRSFGEMVLTEQSLYVAGWTGSGGWTLTSYRLQDGSVQWELPLTAPSRQPGNANLGWYGMPVFVSYDDDGDGLWSARTVTVDPGTGRERWTTDGWPVAGPLPNDRLLFWREERESESPAVSAPVTTLALVDGDTGADIWTVPSGMMSTLEGGDRPNRLVTVDTAGRLTSYDLASGRQLATGSGAADPTGVGPPVPGHLSVAGDLVLLQPQARRPELSAYDLDALTHRWTTNLPAGDGPTACLDDICLVGDVLIKIDLATGEHLWSREVRSRADWLWPMAPEPPWLPGHLLANGWLVEPRTGDPILNLDEWLPQHSAWERRIADAAADPYLVRHELPEGGRPGRSWVARLRMDPPGIEVLGAVHGGLFGCAVGTRYVVCEDEETITVWRTR